MNESIVGEQYRQYSISQHAISMQCRAINNVMLERMMCWTQLESLTHGSPLLVKETLGTPSLKQLRCGEGTIWRSYE